jgi:hypothetical protein
VRRKIAKSGHVESNKLKKLKLTFEDEETPIETDANCRAPAASSSSEAEESRSRSMVTIVRKYEADDAGSQAVLAEACIAADMAAVCRGNAPDQAYFNPLPIRMAPLSDAENLFGEPGPLQSNSGLASYRLVDDPSR